jgi:tetratricopeptide (TPR) repeat protein/predicted Ser/Thr protein kinase
LQVKKQNKKMKNLKDSFDNMFRRAEKENIPQPGIPYKIGDIIGQYYEVCRVLGKGGFGVVYLVYSHESKSVYVYALKTFLDEYLQDKEIRKRFRQEASIWVDLERHPYLVRAYFIDEISGRLYIAMEYIAPNEQGLCSLGDYLQRRPPNIAQSLRWSIQFCYGMEYAYSKGIRSHRDIKPANIMISQDRTVKITDFGLAGVLGTARIMSGIKLNIQQGRIGLSGQTIEGTGFGTPTHMPPEQFINTAGCDERSDIYAFGIVLYQMAAGGRLPFIAPLPRDESEQEQIRFWMAMQRLQSEFPVPRLNSVLFPIIQQCLEKKPYKRYQNFKELRRELEPLLRRETGEVIKPPELKELKMEEWYNKGFSLHNLGRLDEANHCYDKALELNPRDAQIWHNKGDNLQSLGHFDKAIRCYDKEFEIDPQNSHSWNSKGNCLDSLGRFDEAIRCYDKALELDPQNSAAWCNKGNYLKSLGHFDDAIRCYDKALELDPWDSVAWYNKGNCLHNLERFDDAIRCYDKALEIDPQIAAAWDNKGNNLHFLRRFDEAIRCHDKALELDPQNSRAWNNKGICLFSLRRFDEAIQCYDKALELDPRDAVAWDNKGNSLRSLSRFDEAIRCYDKALELNPRRAVIWYNKALVEERLGRKRDAVYSLKQFITMAPDKDAALVEFARYRLQKLEGK